MLNDSIKISRRLLDGLSLLFINKVDIKILVRLFWLYSPWKTGYNNLDPVL